MAQRVGRRRGRRFDLPRRPSCLERGQFQRTAASRASAGNRTDAMGPRQRGGVRALDGSVVARHGLLVSRTASPPLDGSAHRLSIDGPGHGGGWHVRGRWNVRCREPGAVAGRGFCRVAGCHLERWRAGLGRLRAGGAGVAVGVSRPVPGGTGCGCSEPGGAAGPSTAIVLAGSGGGVAGAHHAGGLWHVAADHRLAAGFTREFEPDEQEAMLAHELAHLATGDPAWQQVVNLLCGLLWWQPVVWVLRSRLRAASEAAADEASLLIPEGPRHLAACLVELGRRLTDAPRLGWIPMTGDGYRSNLGRRVRRLLALEPRIWRVPGTTGSALTKSVIVLLLVVAMVFGTAWARPRAALAQGESTMMKLRVTWSDPSRRPRWPFCWDRSRGTLPPTSPSWGAGVDRNASGVVGRGRQSRGRGSPRW